MSGLWNVGGVGVDVKHNSYARYLAKKKGGSALRAEKQTDTLSDKKKIEADFCVELLIDNCIDTCGEVIRLEAILSPIMQMQQR